VERVGLKDAVEATRAFLADVEKDD